MSEFDELDVLIAIRDVAVEKIALDRLDQRVATAFSERPSPGHWRPHARHVGRLIVAVGVLVPVLIVFAVALLSASNRSVAPPTSPSGANASTGTRQQLLRTLGVLRRPPDAASRLAISCVKSSPKPGSAAFRACRTSAISLAFVPFPGAPRFGASSGVRLDTSLIRVVPVPRSGDSVALIPATAPHHQALPGAPKGWTYPSRFTTGRPAQDRRRPALPSCGPMAWRCLGATPHRRCAACSVLSSCPTVSPRSRFSRSV